MSSERISFFVIVFKFVSLLCLIVLQKYFFFSNWQKVFDKICLLLQINYYLCTAFKTNNIVNNIK